MTIFGISVFLVSGIINFIMVLFQILSGFRIIKVKFKVHKITGIVLLITASSHGLYAILSNYVI